MNFITIKEMVYEAYVKTGHEYMWNLEDLKLLIKTNFHLSGDYFKGDQFKQLKTMADVGEVGLINTEVSELLEDIRKDKGLLKQSEECADIVIRVMNYCTRKGINLEKAIINKHLINMNRDELHGGVV